MDKRIDDEEDHYGKVYEHYDDNGSESGLADETDDLAKRNHDAVS